MRARSLATIQWSRISVAASAMSPAAVAWRMASDGRAVIAVPGGRPAVQRADARGLGERQLLPEQLREQVVVAVPDALAVERDEEEVGRLHLAQDPARVLAPGDRVAQGRAEAVEQRGSQEEGADLRGLAAEHLGAEVVHDVAVVARELADELLGVGGSATPEGERGEVETGRPALGAFLEPSDGVVPNPRPCRSFSSDSASSTEKLRSAASISTSSPRARSRASGSAGVDRVAIASSSTRGRWSTKAATLSWICGLVIRW